MTEDLERARHGRKLLQRLTSHEEPMPTLHVSTKAPEPKRASVLPDAMRLPKPALEQRHATGSSVHVKRSNGEETLAYVKEYDVEKALYTVELERLGSGIVKPCEGKHLREAKWFEPLTFSLSRSAASAHLQLAEVVARARGLWLLNREGQPSRSSL